MPMPVSKDISFFRSLGLVHFIGIGGIGLSALAETLLRRGHKVQGSDMQSNAQTQHLKKLGARIFLGHQAKHVARANLVVVSSAVPADNVEYRAARKAGVSTYTRAQMLAALMKAYWTITIAGSHGKTTTTSLIAAILEEARLAPHIINGGIMHAYGSNARLGESRWMVAEADESDGTFLHLPSDISVVTNIDAEHLGPYKSSIAQLQQAFAQYLAQTSPFGFAVLGTDDARLRTLARRMANGGACAPVVGYGKNPSADIRAINIHAHAKGTNFSLSMRRGGVAKSTKSTGWMLTMPGEHNVLNALAAIAVGDKLSIPLSTMRRALRGFRGTKRRFNLVGQWRGMDIYDDYAHHPTEIAACLRSAAALGKARRVIAVVEPHRYSRLQHLFAQYQTALRRAHAVLVLPVYAAGEAARAGISSTALAKALMKRKGAKAYAISAAQLVPKLMQMAQPNDVIICMGAGHISEHAYGLADALRRHTSQTKGASL